MGPLRHLMRAQGLTLTLTLTLALIGIGPLRHLMRAQDYSYLYPYDDLYLTPYTYPYPVVLPPSLTPICITLPPTVLR